MATTLEAEVRSTDGGATIDLHGDIDGGAREAIDAAYTAAAEEKGPVLLNFTEVGYINSTGIALIVGLLARARADGRPVAACGLSDHYRGIFEITRLSDFMSIYPDETAAQAAHERSER
jgi:anti-anti-sigma factor